MDNTTITATFTYPTTEIEAFADRRGYQSEVVNPAYVVTTDANGNITDNGESQTIPNTQTREEFLKDWFKSEVVKILSVDIDRAAQLEAKNIAETNAAEKKALVDQALTIS